MEAQNPPAWSDPSGEATAVAVLLAAGVPRAVAHDRVHAVLAEDAGAAAES